ncbi:MAG TPA: response regulator transcription factor [Bacteroidales bacterium]|nr:response regulator transcription factor [Bacteroidales bacterium]HSA43756.1 response regulator transcription factor [Bacteroidales bacterium]
MNFKQIAIVDDHDLFRDGIRLVLNQIPDFKVVFDSPSGFEFLEYLRTNTPDIVLMDIEMPLINGIDTSMRALEIRPDLKIIALTMFTDELHYVQMLKAGVKGFILKKSNKHLLQQAIEEVSHGGNYYSQEIIQKLASLSIGKRTGEPEQLSEREKEVLDLICKGRTSKEIAEQLFLSIKTVEVHRSNILHKTNVRNAAELIIWAIKNNLISI